jgi:protease-4
MGFTDIQGLLQKIGVTPVVVKSGEYKDIGSPVRTMTDAERTLLQTFSDQVHRQFITAIAEGRHLEYEKVASVADGRILTGENAHELGLVDRLGNLEDAIAWAGEMGGITGKVSAVYAKDKKYTFIKRLAESSLHEIMSQLSAYRLFAGYVL